MALQQRLSLKLAQRLVMTPALQQAIKLLQMTRLELEGVLNQEIVENPVLEDAGEEEDPEETASVEAADANERDAPAGQTDEAAKLNGAEEGAEAAAPEPVEPDEPAMGDIDLDAYFNDYLGPDSTVASTFENREISPIENNLSREIDLYDHLLWQLRMSDASPPLREVAESIIGNLDADGFLRASVEEIRLLGAKEGEAEAYRLQLARAREMEEALAPCPRDNGGAVSVLEAPAPELASREVPVPGYRLEVVERALELVRGFDPPGWAGTRCRRVSWPSSRRGTPRTASPTASSANAGGRSPDASSGSSRVACGFRWRTWRRRSKRSRRSRRGPAASSRTTASSTSNPTWSRSGSAASGRSS